MKEIKNRESEAIEKIRDILHINLLSSQGDSARLIYELCYLRLISDIPFRDCFSCNTSISLEDFIVNYKRFLKSFENRNICFDTELTDNLRNNKMAIELAYRVLSDIEKYKYTLKDLTKLFSILCSYGDHILKNIMFIDLYEGSRKVFNTPAQICKLSNYLLEIDKEDEVLDICSGYGNYLVDVVRCSDYKNISGIEINSELTLISEIRLMSLLANYSIYNDNVFNMDIRKKYDKIFCNYPWGLHFEKYELDFIHDKSKDLVFNWEKMSGSSVDWFFIDLVLSVLKDNGKAVIMLPAGPLFKDVDRQYRKDLVNNGFIESIIKIPTLTKYTSISQYLLVLSKNHSESIKFIDISEQVEKNSLFSVNINMTKVFDIINSDNNPLVKIINKNLLEENGYILTVDNYIGKKEVKYFNPTKLSSFVTDIFRGYQITSKEQKELESETGEYEVLLIGDINDGIISDDLTRINPKKGKYDRYLIQKNDLIISSKGTRIKIAVVGNIEDRKIIASGNLIVMRLDTNIINSQYLELYLNSSDGQNILNSIQTGSVIISINPSKLMDIKISLPSLEKQQYIANKYMIKKQQIQIAKEHIIKLEQEKDNFVQKTIEELFD